MIAHKPRRVKIGSILFWLFMIIAVIVCCMGLHAKKTGEPMTIGGYGFSKIVSGSMEPTIMTDAYVVFEEIDCIEDLEVGDVVIFKNKGFGYGENALFCHRIVKIEGDDILTRGDNNDRDDRYMTPVTDVKGKVVQILNGVGTIRPGHMMLAATLAFGISFVYSDICDRISRRKETSEE